MTSADITGGRIEKRLKEVWECYHLPNLVDDGHGPCEVK